jgi:uncharacterized protein (DUF2147 family)
MIKPLQISLALMLLMSSLGVNANNAILGMWLAHNDQGKPTGYIHIVEENGEYRGYIAKGLETDKEEKYCEACKDERKGQKLVGMTVSSGVKAKGNGYEGKEILDPFSGNTYRVKLSLKSEEKLEVRGFIGLSLFGRTQVWERMQNGQ